MIIIDILSFSNCHGKIMKFEYNDIFIKQRYSNTGPVYKDSNIMLAGSIYWSMKERNVLRIFNTILILIH